MRREIFSYLAIAGRIALQSTQRRRAYMLGAVGLRHDGTLVSACNLPSTHPQPAAHAEARLARKLDHDAVVYVARVLRSGEFALARPCARCQAALESRGVRRVYYTVASKEYGVLEL